MKCGFIPQQVNNLKHKAKITHPLKSDLRKAVKDIWQSYNRYVKIKSN